MLQTCGQASGSHPHLSPSFFGGRSPVFPSHFVISGLFLLPLHLAENQQVSFEMNEWERERRRTNTLQCPGEGNAGAASSPGSIPSPKRCAFHIPAGLPTPGCRMLSQTPFLCTTKNSSARKKWEQTHHVPPVSISVHWYFSTSKSIS